MKLSIYGHFGSQNHGNEAIVRGINELFNHESIELYSYTPDADMEFGLDQLFTIRSFMRVYERYSLTHIFLALWYRLTKSLNLHFAYKLAPFFKDIEGIYLLEAGDQYCENDYVKNFYAYVNKKIINRGGKTVMLPCTISTESFREPRILEDLMNYSLIFARESITYNALIKAGLEESTRYAPCPAFLMKPKQCELSELFLSRSVVGLTIGILAQGKETYSNAVFENSRALIQYILDNTDFAIALIPHVNVNENLTDVTPLHRLYDEFKDSGRIVEISEKKADELKYIISNCRFLVTLRTHASIAAYSSGIPTLVIGYSQKSMGIATDLFGTPKNYVVSVDSLSNKHRLTEAFIWLKENENDIKQQLKQVLPSYLEKARGTYDEIVKIAGDCCV